MRTLKAEAAAHRRTAARYDRKFEENAQAAAGGYESARTLRIHAAWLTGDGPLPGLMTPARWEQQAYMEERYADATLAHAFHYAEQAGFYRELAADYARMAREQAARLARALLLTCT